MLKEKRKKFISILGYIIIAIMAVIFIYQRIVPANFGKEYDRLTIDTMQLNVAFTKGTEGGLSYFTDDPEEIKEFRDYIDNIKLKYRSLADTMSANKPNMDRVIFAVINKAGTISSFQVDERGLIQFNTRVFKVAVPFDEFWKATETMAKSWGEK